MTDLVHVHQSELKTFLKCRLAWFWTGPKPRGLNLEPKRIASPLSFGRLTHQALQLGYDQELPFETVWDSIAPEEADYDLGRAMMAGYQTWAEEADKEVTFLSTEMHWEVERMAGRFDAVVQRSDGIWVLDFKTTKYQDTSWTRTALQATIYTWAARTLFGKKVRGMLYRFLRKKAPYTYEDLILKTGKVTQRSNLDNLTTYEEYAKALAVAVLREMGERQPEVFEAIAEKTGIGTYVGLLEIERAERHAQEWYPEFAKRYKIAQQMYHTELMNLKGKSNFFWEVAEYRTDVQIKRMFDHLINPAMDQILNPKVWVAPTAVSTFMACDNCPFQDPCRLWSEGADFRTLLASEYQERNRDYEGENAGVT